MSRGTMVGVRSLGVAVALTLGLQWMQPHASLAANPTITLTPNSGPPGTAVNVTGSGFKPGETVNIIFGGFGTVASGPATGASGTIAIHFNVPAGATTPGMYTVRATGATSGLSTTANFQVLANTMTTFTVNKFVQANNTGYAQNINAPPGANLSYLIQYQNTGTVTATNVTIRDVLAAGQTFLSASPGCIPSGGAPTTVTCTEPNSPPAPGAGNSGSVVINTQLNANFVGTINNQATLTATGAANTPSNITSVTVGPSQVTATLSKYVSDNGSTYVTSLSANPGDQLSYDIRYTNTSNVATTVTIYDNLAQGQTLLSYPDTSSNCTSFNNQTGQLVCPIGSVPPGTTVHIYIGVIVNAGVNGVIYNTASANVNGVTIHSSDQTSVQVVNGTPPPINNNAQLVLCGPVTAYNGATITISGITVLLQGATQVNGGILVGSNLCLDFFYNGVGQVYTVSISSNLAQVGEICGVYTTSGLANSIRVGGILLQVAAGTSYLPYLNPGNPYCFLLTNSGTIYSVLSGIPTSAHVIHGGGGAFLRYNLEG